MALSVRLQGLAWDDRMRYFAALSTSHRVGTTLTIYDSSQQQIHSLNHALTGGQIDVDSSSPVMRMASLDFARASKGWKEAVDYVAEPGDPLHPSKFIGITYDVWVENMTTGSGFVEVPVFYGSVSRVQTDANNLHVEAKSKEFLFLRPHEFRSWEGVTLLDTSIRKYIRAVAEGAGETKFRLGSEKVPKISFNQTRVDQYVREEGIWVHLQKQARASGCRLFYSADGFLTMEKLSHPEKHPLIAYRFTSGPNGTALSLTDGTTLNQPSGLLTIPTIEYDADQFRNEVRVYVDEPTNTSTAELRGKASLQGLYFGDAVELAWNGQNRKMVEHIYSNAIMSEDRATETAKRWLSRFSALTADTAFDSLPVPHLEPGDVANLNGHPFIVNRFTLPLTSAGSMSVGFNKRVRVVTKTR